MAERFTRKPVTKTIQAVPVKESAIGIVSFETNGIHENFEQILELNQRVESQNQRIMKKCFLDSLKRKKERKESE